MNKTPTAWMLRRDGIAFPCQWHYYGNADPAEVEETLYAAEWLYDATQSEETQRRCLGLIAAYGVALRPNRNLMRNLLLAIRERPYVDTVTVLWDQESSGHSEYLTDEAGHTLDHVPLKEVVQ